MKKQYFAAKDIKNDKGETLVKQGELALTLETPDALGEAKALAGLGNGTLVDEAGMKAIAEKQKKDTATKRKDLQKQIDDLDGKPEAAPAKK